MTANDPESAAPDHLYFYWMARRPPRDAQEFTKTLQRIQVSEDWEHFRETIRRMYDDPSVQAVRDRQAEAMDAIRHRYLSYLRTDLPKRPATEAQLRKAESIVLEVIPKTHEPTAEMEDAVAQVASNPEARKLAEEVAGSLPPAAELAKAGPWAALIMLASVLLQMAPDINSNQLMMLGILLSAYFAFTRARLARNEDGRSRSPGLPQAR